MCEKKGITVNFSYEEVKVIEILSEFVESDSPKDIILKCLSRVQFDIPELKSRIERQAEKNVALSTTVAQCQIAIRKYISAIRGIQALAKHIEEK